MGLTPEENGGNWLPSETDRLRPKMSLICGGRFRRATSSMYNGC